MAVSVASAWEWDADGLSGWILGRCSEAATAWRGEWTLLVQDGSMLSLYILCRAVLEKFS